MKHRDGMKRLVHAIALIIGGALLLAAESTAQPLLDIKWTSVNGTNITMYFQVLCNSIRTYAFDKTNLSVTDNGVPIYDFTLTCPDTTTPCPMSVALVLDESGSMAGMGIDGEKAAAHSFVDQMDGSVDQAAVLGFSTSVHFRCGMTTLKTDLNAAIDHLTANGGTAGWDAIHAGLMEIAANAGNRCRALIFITDGGDNSSTHTPLACFHLADSLMVPLYTVGLGASVDAVWLDSIAKSTGGKFFLAPDAASLTPIVQNIAALIKGVSGLCRLDAASHPCLDGSTHTITTTLQNVCGSGDIKTTTYKTPRDTTTFTHLHMAIPRISMNLYSTMDVPVFVMDTLTGLKLDTTSWHISYDKAHLRFDTAIRPPGSLLEGVPMQIQQTSTGVLLRTTSTISFSTMKMPAPLFYLRFTADSTFGADSLCTDLGLGSWGFHLGCITPHFQNGLLCIRDPSHGQHNNPDIVCVNIDAPDSLMWSPAIKDYALNPFRVRFTVKNTGAAPGKDPLFRIVYSTIDFELVNPPQETQPGASSELAVNDSMTVEWQMRAKRHASAYRVPLCLETRFSNQLPSSCCTKIWIAHADLPTMTFECKIDTPKIVYNRVLDEYSPMPFDVKIQLWNSGSVAIDSLSARILLPPEIALAGADAPDKFLKTMFPVTLNPGQTGTATWWLSIEKSAAGKTLSIGMLVMTKSGDSSYCATELAVPPIPSAKLEPQCIVPPALVFDNASGLFQPDPFDVVLFCKNTGEQSAGNVRGTIMLPPGMVLFNPSDSLTKTFQPMVIPPFISGDTAPKLVWQARVIAPPQNPSLMRIRFNITGTDEINHAALDTATTECDVVLPGVGTTYSCAGGTTGNPDSLSRTFDNTDLSPNPFTWTVAITNAGAFTSSIVKAEINFSAHSLTLDSLTPAVRFPNQLLRSGRNFQIGWLIHAALQWQPRSETIKAVFTDDRGTTIACSGELRVPGVSGLISCNLNTSERSLLYDPAVRQYKPESWTISDTLVNSGKLPLTNLRALIQWTNAGSVPFAGLDPGFPGNVNPGTIAMLPAGQSAQFTWGFRIIADNNSSNAERVMFNVKYKSDEQDDIPGGCSDWVDVGPAGTLGVEGAALPSQFRLYQNHPNPFSATTSISYDLPSAAFVIVTIHDLLGRELRRLLNARQNAGHYALPFDASELQSGMYLYQLTAGRFTETRRMMVVK
jgi:hypothetical protein